MLWPTLFASKIRICLATVGLAVWAAAWRYVYPAMSLQTSSRSCAMAFAPREPATAKAIRLADAVATIGAHLCSIPDTELVDLSQARGRILAEDLIAMVSLPHWDSAAVDGFALRAPDLLPGRHNGLTMVGEAAAGRPFPGIVGAGQAVRILTGAPLPQGADLVVMQEACRIDVPVLLFKRAPQARRIGVCAVRTSASAHARSLRGGACAHKTLH